MEPIEWLVAGGMTLILTLAAVITAHMYRGYRGKHE